MATLSLPDAANGNAEFAFKADPGRLLVVYFGYTSCPDVCPTTLADVRSALEDIRLLVRKLDEVRASGVAVLAVVTFVLWPEGTVELLVGSALYLADKRLRSTAEGWQTARSSKIRFDK